MHKRKRGAHPVLPEIATPSFQPTLSRTSRNPQRIVNLATWYSRPVYHPSLVREPASHREPSQKATSVRPSPVVHTLVRFLEDLFANEIAMQPTLVSISCSLSLFIYLAPSPSCSVPTSLLGLSLSLWKCLANLLQHPDLLLLRYATRDDWRVLLELPLFSFSTGFQHCYQSNFHLQLTIFSKYFYC